MATDQRGAAKNWGNPHYDEVERIFDLLNWESLENAAKVNKAWRNFALEEIKKRRYIQQLHMPFGLWTNQSKLRSLISRLSDKVRVDAQVSVFICNVELRSSACSQSSASSVNKMLLQHFQKKNKAFAVSGCANLHSETLKFVDPENRIDFDPAVRPGLLGLFFPEVKNRVRVQLVSALNLYGHPSETVEHIARELDLLDPNRPKSSLFIFAYSYQGFRLAEALRKERTHREKETVWLGIFENSPKTVGCNNRCGCENLKATSEKNIIVLRLSGWGVRSWAALIDCRWPSDEIEWRLEELKSRVIAKENCAGLIYATHNNLNATSDQLMRKVKSVFDGIPFSGLFVQRNWTPIVHTQGLKCYLTYSMYAISIIITSYR